MSMLRFILAITLLAAPAAADEDPRLWLEEVEGEDALDWARERNAESIATYASDEAFETLRTRLLAVYDSPSRIPSARKIGLRYYNLWTDAANPRGLWRRTTLESYRTDEPEWETVLDLDALGAEEGENWVWKGAECLGPEYRRCLLFLSRGGADATVMREFDLQEKAFVPDGFFMPEAKQEADWVDPNTLFISSDFGPGSLTESGYERTTRRWVRGTPVEDAPQVFEGEVTDVAASAGVYDMPGFELHYGHRSVTFWTTEVYLLGKKGPSKIDKPDGAVLDFWRDQILLRLRKDWTVEGTSYPAGSLLIAPLRPWMRGKKRITVLFTPSASTSLDDVVRLRDRLLLNTLENVVSRVEVLTPGAISWSRAPLPGAPPMGRVQVSAVDARASNAYWLSATDFLTPWTLSYGVAGAQEPTRLKSLPAYFDPADLAVSQHLATSKDGTKVPYFQVGRADLPLDGSNPTLLYGYGGFEVSLLPYYSATRGIGWLEKGGVFVLANIRGGGEFGPGWHQAALREKRHTAYEDFAAVADDLVARRVTSPARLAAEGGSNGGLLIGNMYTTYPERFGALVCMVPLLDMQRYNKLLAGASWVGEYGDPDVPEDWAFLQAYSPYHNVDPAADHPPIFLSTSTRDDRVHPGHARKMTALLRELGEDVVYYENVEGGHGLSADNAQAAFVNALSNRFVWKSLTSAAPETDGVEPSESGAAPTASEAAGEGAPISKSDPEPVQEEPAPEPAEAGSSGESDPAPAEPQPAE